MLIPNPVVLGLPGKSIPGRKVAEEVPCMGIPTLRGISSLGADEPRTGLSLLSTKKKVFLQSGPSPPI